MPSRGLTIHQEIQEAVAARERLVLVVRPKAAVTWNSWSNCRPKREGGWICRNGI